jgi:hypothetical protein
MPNTETKPVKIEDLTFDLSNPRYPPRTSQRDAIEKIAEHQGMKLVRLAEDIVDKGLNPTKRILVAPADDGSFVVLEGNRRIAALKLLAQKELRSSLNLKPRIEKKLRALSDQAQADGTLPTMVDCVVTTREEANYWIQLEHTGENEGVGVVDWDGPARQRFRGGSPALQAVDLATPYLDGKTQELLPQIAHTNIERILNTPEARQALGVDLNNGKVTLGEPEDRARARLVAVVSDVANRVIRVTQLHSKDQRVAYAKDVAARPLTPIAGPIEKSGSGAKDTATSGASRPTRRVAVHRTTLIPRHFKVSIKQGRINRIYDELQRLQLTKFVNSGAVLLRVFVELSIDEYAKGHSLSLRVHPQAKPGRKTASIPREMKLREKLKAAADHLEAKGVSTKHELRGVRVLLHKQNHPLSVDSLHSYVHNQHYSPTIEDLATTWDNIEAFMSGLWKP